MKLLFVENLSPRLVGALASTYPGSRHVDEVRLHGQPDGEIWRYAQQHGFAIVSKDDDFRQLSFMHGAPPKVVWLAVGNAGTRALQRCLPAVAMGWIRLRPIQKRVSSFWPSASLRDGRDADAG